MLVGGAAAAVLGYGVAAYSSQAVWPFDAATDTSFEDEVRGALTTQDGALSDLGARLSSLEGMEPPSVDLTPVQDQIAAVQATAADLTARLDEIVSRIDTLERQPLESSVSEEAIAAYERALADLQAEIETQRVEVAQMAQDAVAAEENAEEEELEEYELYIKGMTCANCEVKVKEALLNCSGIKNAWVSHEEGSAVIEADSDLMDYDEIAGAVENAGFTVIDEEE